ncbi:hypothetical protein C8R47DRAFT_1084594 [Mycena vitilis]|nr:hypothetical protein C8R47DRAFT_1084594 [Mycena vitilis]
MWCRREVGKNVVVVLGPWFWRGSWFKNEVEDLVEDVNQVELQLEVQSTPSTIISLSGSGEDSGVGTHISSVSDKAGPPFDPGIRTTTVDSAGTRAGYATAALVAQQKAAFVDATVAYYAALIGIQRKANQTAPKTYLGSGGQILVNSDNQNSHARTDAILILALARTREIGSRIDGFHQKMQAEKQDTSTEHSENIPGPPARQCSGKDLGKEGRDRRAPHPYVPTGANVPPWTGHVSAFGGSGQAQPNNDVEHPRWTPPITIIQQWLGHKFNPVTPVSNGGGSNNGGATRGVLNGDVQSPACHPFETPPFLDCGVSTVPRLAQQMGYIYSPAKKNESRKSGGGRIHDGKCRAIRPSVWLPSRLFGMQSDYSDKPPGMPTSRRQAAKAMQQRPFDASYHQDRMFTGERLLATAPAALLSAMRSPIPNQILLDCWRRHCTIGYCYARTDATKNHPNNRAPSLKTVAALVEAFEAHEWDPMQHPILVTPEADNHSLPAMDLDCFEHPKSPDGTPLMLCVVSGWHRMTGLKQLAEKSGQTLTWWAEVIHPVFWEPLNRVHIQAVFVVPNLPSEDISNPASVADQLRYALNIIVGAEKHDDAEARTAAIMALEQTLAGSRILSAKRYHGIEQQWRLGVQLMLPCPELLEEILKYLDECPLLASWDDDKLSKFILNFATTVTGCEDYAIQELRRFQKEERGSSFTPEGRWEQLQTSERRGLYPAFQFWVNRVGSTEQQDSFNETTCPAYFKPAEVKAAMAAKGGAERARFLSHNAAKKGWFWRNCVTVRAVLRVIALVLGGPDVVMLVGRGRENAGRIYGTTHAHDIVVHRELMFRSWLIRYIKDRSLGDDPVDYLQKVILPAVIQAIGAHTWTLWTKQMEEAVAEASAGLLTRQCQAQGSTSPTREVCEALAKTVNNYILSSPPFHHILVALLQLSVGQPFCWAPTVHVTTEAPVACLSIIRNLAFEKTQQEALAAKVKAQKAEQTFLKAQAESARQQEKLDETKKGHDDARRKEQEEQTAAVDKIMGAQKKKQERAEARRNQEFVEMENELQQTVQARTYLQEIAVEHSQHSAHVEETARQVPDMEQSRLLTLMDKDAPLDALVRLAEEEESEEWDDRPSDRQLTKVQNLLTKISSHHMDGLIELMQDYIDRVRKADNHNDNDDESDDDDPPPPPHQQSVAVQCSPPPSSEANTDVDGDVNMLGCQTESHNGSHNFTHLDWGDLAQALSLGAPDSSSDLWLDFVSSQLRNHPMPDFSCNPMFNLSAAALEFYLDGNNCLQVDNSEQNSRLDQTIFDMFSTPNVQHSEEVPATMHIALVD